MSKIVYYSVGIIHISVCVPKEMKRVEITKDANAKYPTGISSKWKIHKGNFHNGNSNPCQCDQEEDRLHYLLSC